MQRGIKRQGRMSFGEHKAVPLGIIGAGNVHDIPIQRGDDIGQPPKLLAPECVHIAYNDLQNYATYMNANSFYGVAYHLYGDSSDGTADGFIGNLSLATNVFPNKPHFMTEYGMSDMIQTACLIHNCLTAGQDSGFNYWSLVWPGNDG